MESKKSAEELIFEIIENNGYVTVDELILISNSYYYKSGISIGSDGDFTTSPEISQMFGEMISIWIIMEWQKLGFPNPLALVELGPGKGTLMRDILRSTKNVSNFHEALCINFLEFSPHLATIQSEAVAEYDIKKSWIKSVNDIPKIPTILIANEFFDALPVKQYVNIDGTWKELVVKFAEHKKLLFTTIDDDIITSHQILEKSPISLEIMKNIASHISRHSGAALIIDYGYDIKPETRKSSQYNSTIQAIKTHKYTDILESIGSADISCHVDFYALKNAAFETKADMNIIGSITQSEFLKNLEIETRLKMLIKKNPELAETLIKQHQRLTSKDSMGELFKAIIVESFTH